MTKIPDYQRYQRQLLLNELGQSGQDKLQHAKVLVIGAGGLGCPALQYLAAAGIGDIGIVDADLIDLTNLHRQILYTMQDIGQPKATTAARKLQDLNPDIQITPFDLFLTNQNALEIVAEYDIVIDGSDNFTTRYLLNDACVMLGKPLVYGAVMRFEGQVGVFNLASKDVKHATNYRDLFPAPPNNSSAFSCNEVGVLGVLPGIIGMLQATEAIKIVTGIGTPLCNTILTYNALQNSFYEFEISARLSTITDIPIDKTAFELYDYQGFCNAQEDVAEISPEAFNILLQNIGEVSIIDVREQHELPIIDQFPCSKIPFSMFESNLSSISEQKTIIVFCQTGVRSISAARLLQRKYASASIYSLSGGVVNWLMNGKPI
jgi:molybdopterin/thiamine biosynthesis adenylyltransferase/rhodanese-related sulfurtransferase